MTTPGSKYKVITTAALGYGERGARATSGPDATLICEGERHSIEKEEAVEQPKAAAKKK